MYMCTSKCFTQSNTKLHQISLLLGLSTHRASLYTFTTLKLMHYLLYSDRTPHSPDTIMIVVRRELIAVCVVDV